MSQTKYDDIQQKLQCVFKSGAQCKKKATGEGSQAEKVYIDY